MKRYTTALTLLFLFIIPQLAISQVSLDYYLPDDITYNPAVPTPEEVIGHQVGEWHITHDKLVFYMRAVAEASDRVTYQEFAYTYEDRPLVMLTITSPENHSSLDRIKENHHRLKSPAESGDLDLSTMPVIINLGYSVHGNEPSGSNASLLMAYYYAAAQGDEIDEILENSVILLDPSLNPDGLQRFSTWANQHKSIHGTVTDPSSREYGEVWPGGRTNHYWFDLNRDWMPVQHPSSRGRIQLFQEWMPNVLTDFHEMGTNATYFFQPGVPERTHPLTPQRNQDLTMAIAEYHADALDDRQELYYTRERFDDFYYGKGSTYPDIFGSVGILFEQASSRGHAQESIHGVIEFPYTILNQVTTSFSTVKASIELREELLDHMRTFYREAENEASGSSVKGIVVGDSYDRARTWHLADLLSFHDIEMYTLAEDFENNGTSFSAGEAIVIPMEQTQFKFLEGIFEQRTEFPDSLFYDVSTWTLPYAFNLPFAELSQRQFSSSLMGDRIESPEFPEGRVIGGRSQYAYLFEWDGYYAPRALHRLQNAGVKTKVSGTTFQSVTTGGVRDFDYGTILVPLGIQDVDEMEIFRMMQQAAQEDGLDIYSVGRGLNPSGIDLGSPSFSILEKPETVILGGSGVRGNDVGEIWHLFDQRFHMPITILEKDRVGRSDLSRYNTMILVQGNYNDLSSNDVDEIKRWVRRGGTLILNKSAVNWGVREGLANVEFVERPSDDSEKRPYAELSDARGAQVIGGSIFHGELDLTHPLAYGYNREDITVFRNSNTFMKPAENPYATPLRYTSDPLASGYISDENLELIGDTASIIVSSYGRGRVISMIDNPAFRAFWFGTNKLLMNAVFFGDTISGAASN
ncbi:zinc carboxypeptidase [Rhodohalobacter sp. SW132]|nr:M14 family zinc carboxypeptidase [Rhodohalobacter sp. SW132]REL39280.1 zinc carboxypeptidase [Rhodohalobacter sp. SW132]